MGLFELLLLLVVIALLAAGLLGQLAWKVALTFCLLAAAIYFVIWLLRMYLPPRKP